MLIDLFIKAKWYTVPLKGKLERLEKGKKTDPIFPKNWNTYYRENFNIEQSPLASALTGKKSNIIAIDCDNQLTYDLFKGLDPNYKFHFISKGKPEGGGTIVYNYTGKIESFVIKSDGILLDFLSENRAIYLPTENNNTKESWDDFEDLPDITDVPDTVLAMLQIFALKNNSVKETKENEHRHVISNRLAPMLENFIKSKKYTPILFRILTPYAFRDLPPYVAKGHLHPNEVPKGRGSEYLSKISAILGADISVNIELYTNTIMFINALKAKPKEKTELLNTIINPMIEGRSSIEGKTIWQFDPHWNQMGFIATALNGDYIESFYDDIKGLYYLVNYTVPYLRIFNDKRPLITTIKTLLGKSITEQTYDISKQLIRTNLNPSLEFGHIKGTDKFNLFRQTKELAIINDPSIYKTQYKRPETTIKFFESLIPDDFIRNYVLSFMKTKLTTFNYSPVVLYLIGKPGSGKDTLVGIFRRLIGQDYVAKPETKVFLEAYNGWLVDKYIVQLDEYGNKLIRRSDKQEVLGKIKAYTGSPEFQVRAMRTDGFNYRHSMTFILTANSNPLPVEIDDRRFVFIKTPNKLQTEQWIADLGGVTRFQELLKEETLSFCYYLGTEIKALKPDDYVIAPLTKDKEQLVIDSLPAADKILYYIQNNKWEELIFLSEDYNIIAFDKGWEKGRLMENKLSELYDLMTEGAGSFKVIVRLLRSIGIKRGHTTKNGLNIFYFYFHNLHLFKKKREGKENYIEAKHSGIKGLK